MAARDQHGPNPPFGGEFSVIGKPHRKVDAMAKATGEAVYTDDIQLPGMLHAKTLRSPHPHARIVASTRAARWRMPGRSRGHHRQGHARALRRHSLDAGRERPGRGQGRFIGDGVAAVAAVDEDTAIEACERSRSTASCCRPCSDPEEALAAGEPTDPRRQEGQRSPSTSPGVRRRRWRRSPGRTWWSKASTSSRAPRTRRSSRTAPWRASSRTAC